MYNINHFHRPIIPLTQLAPLHLINHKLILHPDAHRELGQEREKKNIAVRVAELPSEKLRKNDPRAVGSATDHFITLERSSGIARNNCINTRNFTDGRIKQKLNTKGRFEGGEF